MTFATSQVVYRDLGTSAWGQFRLYWGGKDVTFFRGVPVQIGQYQLTDPYAYGSASFAFPQITTSDKKYWQNGILNPDEVDPTHQVAPWFGPDKDVRLVQVDPSGAIVRTVWRGTGSDFAVDSDTGTTVTCDGHARGRLTTWYRPPALHYFDRDAGRFVYDVFNSARISMTPRYGPVTGISLSNRGRSGMAIDVCDGLLADTLNTSGHGYTILATPGGGYEMVEKDTTTVAFTVFELAAGVKLSLHRDVTQETTTVFGSGVQHDGRVFANERYPRMIQGTPPSFPGTLSPGDSGSDVFVLEMHLQATGLLDQANVDGIFDSDTTDAVKDVQDAAGLSQTGVVNSATWDAIFTILSGQLSTDNSFIAPYAETTETKVWNRTSTGVVIGPNSGYNPQAIPRHAYYDHGTGVEEKRVRKWSKNELSRAQSGENWVGTITLTADVATGDVHSTDTIVPMSRLDIVPGTNLRARNFDDTKFYVSMVTVNGDLSVELAVDTKARDIATLAAIHQRRQDARMHPARAFFRDRKHSGAHQGSVQWNKQAGFLSQKQTLPANQWTTFPVIGGDGGTIGKIRIQLDDNTEFAVAVTAKPVGDGYMNSKVPNPLASGSSQWLTSKAYKEIDQNRAIIFAAGTHDQPCGHDGPGPGVTGLFLDGGSWPYYTTDECELTIAIYPLADTSVSAQRILWASLQAV